jgi:rod shape-determining protein MreC
LAKRPGSITTITQPLRNFAQRFTYLFLVLLAFGVMLIGKADAVLVERIRASVVDAMAPILTAMATPIATVADGIHNVRNLAAMREENIVLREENRRLLQWQMVARKLEAENAGLQSLLNFSESPEPRFVTARVIADSGGVFAHSLVLNAGADKGVAKGQVVMTDEGFIGRVTEVGGRSARVLLVTDINSRGPVLLESTRDRAILAGTNTDRARLIHLPPGAKVSPGERVVTSGHGGAFPPGLPVGTVASVSDGGVQVQPFLDRARVEFVRAVDFGLAGILGQEEAAPVPAR